MDRVPSASTFILRKKLVFDRFGRHVGEDLHRFDLLLGLIENSVAVV